MIERRIHAATLALIAAVVAVVAPALAQVARSEGEVRKVDREVAKVTIRHGPVPEFDMQGMTMVFRVADPALLDRLKSGDRIVFTMTKIGGAFAVTAVEPAP